MAIELVTAYKGKDHVTAEQWADFNRGIYGDAAILPVGNKMETAIQTANQITVKDGVAVIDGRQVYIGYGESENIAIQSGTQGKLRRDIVVLEYKKEEVSGVETVQFKVITGTPADSDVKDPSVQDMDIRTGVFTSQKPFCRVRLNGTAIEGVDTLIPVKEFKSHAFAAPVNNLTGTNPDLALAATQGREIKKQIDALNSSLTAKIIIGKHNNASLLFSDVTIAFTNGNAIVSMSDFNELIGKTLVGAMAQLKSASAAIITSCRITDDRTVEIKCTNITGSKFEGQIATTLLLIVI